MQSCTNNYSHFKNSSYLSTGLCLRLRVLGHQTLNDYVAQTTQNELGISWLNDNIESEVHKSISLLDETGTMQVWEARCISWAIAQVSLIPTTTASQSLLKPHVWLHGVSLVPSKNGGWYCESSSWMDCMVFGMSCDHCVTGPLRGASPEIP